MKIRFVLLTGLGAICFGCATPPEQDLAALGAASAKAATASAPTQVRPRPSLTGSRLPPLDDDDVGTSYVSGVTGDEYRNNEAFRVKILCGENPRACFGK